MSPLLSSPKTDAADLAALGACGSSRVAARSAAARLHSAAIRSSPSAAVTGGGCSAGGSGGGSGSAGALRAAVSHTDASASRSLIAEAVEVSVRSSTRLARVVSVRGPGMAGAALVGRGRCSSDGVLSLDEPAPVRGLGIAGAGMLDAGLGIEAGLGIVGAGIVEAGLGIVGVGSDGAGIVDAGLGIDDAGLGIVTADGGRTVAASGIGAGLGSSSLGLPVVLGLGMAGVALGFKGAPRPVAAGSSTSGERCSGAGCPGAGPAAGCSGSLLLALVFGLGMLGVARGLPKGAGAAGSSGGVAAAP